MKIEIYGNSLGCAYLALYLNQRTNDVTWFYDPSEALSLRPARLDAHSLSQLKTLSRRYQISLSELHQAPLIKQWSCLDSFSERDAWEGFQKNYDRWVDSALLISKFRLAAENSGVRVIYTEIMPRYMGNSADFTIVDVRREKLPLWNNSFFQNPAPARFKGAMTSIHFPKAPRTRTEEGMVFTHQGVSSFIEGHATKGVVLTSFHPSRQILDKTLESYLNPKAQDKDLPLSMKVLCTLNPNALTQRAATYRGVNGLMAPNVFPIGDAIGSLCPENNQQVQLSLNHALGLASIFNPNLSKKPSQVLSLSQRWTVRKNKDFQRRYRMTKIWKNFVLSGKMQKYALRAHAILPPFLRQRLQSPL